VARARAEYPGLAAERFEARAAGQGPAEASRAFLPGLQIDVMGLRTTDPVAVFGGRLRQGRFAQEDFALDALNAPAPFSDWTASATVRQPVFAPEGWFGYRAARLGARAREAAAGRAAGIVTFQVTRAYWGAVFAGRRVETLDTALNAARAHAAQAEALQAQGLVTGLDARLARMRASATEVERLGAAADAANAMTSLKALLDIPDDHPIVLTDSLEGALRSSVDTGMFAPSLLDRGDLRALDLGASASSAAVGRAWAAQLPSLGVFGSVAHRSGDAPWGSGSGDWTIGVALTWRPFQGLGLVGGVRRAEAERDAARARRAAAERQARVESAQAERAVTTAQAQISVAERAVAEAAAALDQARLRYRTGASSITELLDVHAAATAAELNMLLARRDYLLARAARELAYGVHDE